MNVNPKEEEHVTTEKFKLGKISSMY